MALLLAAAMANSALAALPPPLASWTFEDGPRDQMGILHGQLVRGAKVVRGRLVLDGNGYLQAGPLASSISVKTLVARVRVDPLTQGGGGVLTVQTIGGAVFDSIVYGEREAQKWIAGSDWFNRTRDLEGAPLEESVDRFVHMAIVYAADGSIAVYRDGMPYGAIYRQGAGPVLYGAGFSEVLIGMRHEGGWNPYFKGEIEEAALYDQALTAAQVAELAAAKVSKDDNLVLNAGFESGTLAGWRVTGHLASGTNLPASLVGTAAAAQGRFSVLPIGGPDGMRLAQTVKVEPGREHVLSFGHLAVAPVTGSIRVEIDGESIGDEAIGASLPNFVDGSVRTNWAYGRRFFTPTNNSVEIAFQFPPETRGKVRLDDVRLAPVPEEGARIAVALVPGPIALREREPAWLTVRRTGGWDEWAYATLELVAGTAAVEGEGADLVFSAAPGGLRVGVVFRPGESEVRVGIVARPDGMTESVEGATARLVATGNASVEGEAVPLSISDAPSLRGGMEFDGIGQSVVIAHDPALNPFPLGVSFWMKSTQKDFFAGLLGKYISGSGNGWSIHLMEGRIHAYLFRSWGSHLWGGDLPTDRLQGGVVADGDWHHIAFAADNGGGRLYVDGQLKDSILWTGSAGAATSPVNLTLGCVPILEDGTGLAHFRGRLDEVRIWSKAMTEAEVRASMFGALQGNEAGLVAYLDFNQTSGTTLTNRAATGARLDGILRGSTNPRWVDVDDLTEAPGPIVVNGGFESPALEPWYWTDYPLELVKQPKPSFSALYSAELTRFFESPDSTQDQRLSQVLNTEPGKAYRLSFAYGVQKRSRGTLGIGVGGVMLEGVPVEGDVLMPTAAASGTGAWQYATRTFTATSNRTELGFTIPPSLSSALCIDDVRVVPASEPEDKAVIELEAASLRLEEGLGGRLTLRRVGRLDQRSFATLVLEPGTALVTGPGTDLRFAAVAATDRIGVMFQPGESVRTVDVLAVTDVEREEPETATLRLVPTGNAHVRGEPVSVTVVTPPTLVEIEPRSSARESEGVIRFRMDVLRGSPSRVRVETTSAGTATPGVDFIPLSVELDVLPGKPATVSIQLLTDERIEGTETIGVRVTPISPDTRVSQSEFLLEVRDASEVFIFAAPSSNVLRESETKATFVIQRIGAMTNAQSFRIRYRVQGLQEADPDQNVAPARDGIDFVAVAGEVEFGPGIVSRSIEVPLLNDTIVDGSRGIEFRLIGSPDFPDSAGIGFGGAVLIVEDDERAMLWQDVVLDPYVPRREWQEQAWQVAGGKTLIRNGGRLMRLTASGLPDPGFGNGTGVVELPQQFAEDPYWDVRELKDARLVVEHESTDGRRFLSRWTPAGAPDPSFGSGSGVVELAPEVYAIAEVREDGSLLVWASATEWGERFLRLLQADGTEASGFALATIPSTWRGDVRTAPDGRLWMSRWNEDSSGAAVVRRESNGAAGLGTTEWPGLSAIFGFDAQGRAYCGVDPETGAAFGANPQGGIVRILPDGQVDPAYRPFEAGISVRFARIEADGSVLAIHDRGEGSSFAWSLIELGPDGVVRSDRALPGSPRGSVVGLRALAGDRILIDVEVLQFWSFRRENWIFESDGTLWPLHGTAADLALGQLSPQSIAMWFRSEWGGATPVTAEPGMWTGLVRVVEPTAGSQAGLGRTGVVVRGSKGRLQAFRTGSTSENATFRGKILPWGRAEWDEAAAVTFEAQFEMGRADAMLTMDFPGSVRPVPIREFLVRLESGDGVEISALNECRVWVVAESAVPESGMLRMGRTTAPDTSRVVWLIGRVTPQRDPGLLSSPEVRGPYQADPWWYGPLFVDDTAWVGVVSREPESERFYRVVR